MNMTSHRQAMEFDVIIVGAGPAGLAAAIRLKQLANAAQYDIDICLIEKGATIGAHIISGAVFESTALNELIPDWQTLGAPIQTRVDRDRVIILSTSQRAIQVPHWAIPKTMRNQGNHIISLGKLCRWLADYADNLGVNIFPGFAGTEILFDASKNVIGVATGEQGIDRHGMHQSTYEPGIELLGKYTLFAEGCRGSLGKQLIEIFALDKGRDPQHYALGIKELWQIPKDQHRSGLVMHSIGWPLSESRTRGGGFVYHFDEDLLAIGLITDLSYQNPHLSPFDEMQRYKTHPEIRQYLSGGQRIEYGARVIVKGGLQSLPEMAFPGGFIIGDNAGILNYAKIKGNHTAMKSGMLSAEVVFAALYQHNNSPQKILSHDDIAKRHRHHFKTSWLYKELHQQRNFGPAQYRWGNIIGSAYAYIDLNCCNGKLPWTLSARQPDHCTLKPSAECTVINYPKADGVLTFDQLSSLYLSNLSHDDNQPGHLILNDSSAAIQSNVEQFDEPAQRYCPANVYEIVKDNQSAPGYRLQINAQNCIHCKACDIKDPQQNITWTPPQGGSGPNYSDM